MSDVTTVLLVEDDADSALAVTVPLRHTPGFEVALVKSLQQAEAHLRQTTPDVLLLDLTLPDSQGLETFRRIKKLPTVRRAGPPAQFPEEPTA